MLSSRLKTNQVIDWRRILSGAAWRCKDPMHNGVIKQCGAVLSNHREPFLYSFEAQGDSTDCESTRGEEFRFWWCPIGQCIRDSNHCQGQCPWGHEFDRYRGNCRELQCLEHQRICDNSCIVESRSCHGVCAGDKHFCHEDGWCRDPRVPCGANRTCPEDRHYCQRSNICQPNSQTCGYQTCLAPGHKYCYSTGGCLPPGHRDCVEWCTDNRRLCGDACVTLTEPCKGSCAAGYWACPAQSSLLCIPRFRQCHGRCHQDDELCLDEIGRTVCFPRGTCPFSVASITTAATTTAATATTTATSAEIESDGVNFVGNSSCPEHSSPCGGGCIRDEQILKDRGSGQSGQMFL